MTREYSPNSRSSKPYQARYQCDPLDNLLAPTGPWNTLIRVMGDCSGSIRKGRQDSTKFDSKKNGLLYFLSLPSIIIFDLY